MCVSICINDINLLGLIKVTVYFARSESHDRTNKGYFLFEDRAEEWIKSKTLVGGCTLGALLTAGTSIYHHIGTWPSYIGAYA